MTYPKIDTEMFIWEIQNRPALWDVTNCEYGKTDRKRQCWEEIVDIFADENADENEKRNYGMVLQKRWKNLRGCFTRELMRQRSYMSSSYTKRKSHYVYFNNLLFLKESVDKIRKAKQEVQNKNSDDLLSVADEKSPDDTEDHSETEDHSIGTESDYDKQNVKQKESGSYLDSDPLSVLNKNVNSVQDNTIHEEDEERMFLLSLVKPLKRVPDEDRLSVQMEIMNVINTALKKSSSYSAPPSYHLLKVNSNYSVTQESEQSSNVHMIT